MGLSEALSPHCTALDGVTRSDETVGVKSHCDSHTPLNPWLVPVKFQPTPTTRDNDNTRQKRTAGRSESLLVLWNHFFTFSMIIHHRVF